MNDERKTGGCACQGAGPMLTNVARNVFDSMAPMEAGKHFRAARVEFLKGLRSLLDSRIEDLSRTKTTDHMGSSIPVD